ncbi:MAG TPA: hypothetical protein PLJ60_00750 [Chryseolinea sp.]|nr:hypothetical protein [Chryseolinea sp.]HPH47695.1 hypothetical protein [Chryseolinea sp.]HPM28836.1 hypothetical protein [Chryseolinea sp.]
MNRYEEELQRNLEAGQHPEGNELDVKAYQSVFNALRKEPEFTLSSSFADKLVGMAVKKQQSKNIFREYFWFGFGIFLMLIAFVVTIAMTGFKLDMGFLNGLNSFKGVIIFGLFFIGFLHWLDKRLIRPTQTN